MRPFYLFLLILSCQISWGQTLYNRNRHNAALNSGWVSCSATDNPNNLRGSGHWILYDFGENHLLDNFLFWNLNDHAMLVDGLKKFSMDVSVDGEIWSEVGTYDVAMASGSSFYLGQTGPALDFIEARYVLITAIENHGGSCYGFSEIKFNVSQTSLPVTLLHQDVTCNDSGTGNLLSWSTENENNNQAFLIYRSYDGQSWAEIAQINGRNRKTREWYIYEDKSIRAEKVYYQIRQQDFNGHTTFFDVLKSSCENKTPDLTIIQNPVREILYYSYQSYGNGTGSISIVDLMGKIVHNENLDLKDSSRSSQIGIGHLPSASYILMINDGGEISRKKFQKL